MPRVTIGDADGARDGSGLVAPSKLRHGGLTGSIIATFYDVYNELGYGFFESVYRRSLAIALVERGLHVALEAGIEVRFHGHVVGEFRADLLVEDRVILELKAAPRLRGEDGLQLLNYLRATDLEVGLLLHFGPRPSFQRFIMSR